MNIQTKYELNEEVEAFSPEIWDKSLGHVYEIKITNGGWILYHIKFQDADLKNCWCVEEIISKRIK